MPTQWVGPDRQIGTLLPNQPNWLTQQTFGNTNLRIWARGDVLSADDLNANFMALLSLIQASAAQASASDAALAGDLHAVEVLDARLCAVEQHVTATDRQRNLRQFAPLEAVGALMRRIDRLQAELDALKAERR